MLTHAILAAGRGTRLFGDAGGNKPMVPVGNGHLIDYVVREAEGLPLAETRVLVPESDETIVARVRSITKSSVMGLPSPSDGTGPGVRRLLAGTGQSTVILSTCDLAAPPGALADFFVHALKVVDVREPRCVVATSAPADEDPVPIFVHVEGGVVSRYGKDVPSSTRTFAGARVMNSAFRDQLLRLENALATDTRMMSEIVTVMPGSVLQIDVVGLFDVDDQPTLARAELLTREGRAGLLPEPAVQYSPR
jgi:choline kinase